MSQGSFALIISDEYLQTWPRAGSTRDGIAYLRQPLARLTRETDSGLLPTPTDVRKGGGSSRSGNRIDEIPTLQGMARQRKWPTPTKTNSSYTSQASKTKYRAGPTLAEAVQMWPTPTVGDSRSARNSTANRRTIPLTGVHPGDTLVDAVTKFPTPTRTDATKWNNNTVAQRKEKHLSVRLPNVVAEGNGGALNPTWVEWLMGWPIGWTGLERLEMDKFQRWLEQHGCC